MLPTLALLVFASGCWESSNSVQVDALRYDPQNIASDTVVARRWEQAYQVIADHCLACHQDYRTTSQEDFIDMGLALPGMSIHSPLYVALKGAGVSVENESMPPEGVLTNAELSAIRNWIDGLQ